MLWGLAWAVDLLWLIIGVLASNTFLVAGAVIYGLVLVAFLAAELHGRPDEEPSVLDDPQ